MSRRALSRILKHHYHYKHRLLSAELPSPAAQPQQGSEEAAHPAATSQWKEQSRGRHAGTEPYSEPHCKLLNLLQLWPDSCAVLRSLEQGLGPLPGHWGCHCLCHVPAHLLSKAQRAREMAEASPPHLQSRLLSRHGAGDSQLGHGARLVLWSSADP